MFQVMEVRRGLWWDKVSLVATADASHVRRRLSSDSLGAPDVKREVAAVRRGDAFFVRLRRNRVEAGQSIALEQVATWWAFRKLWKRLR